MAIKSEIVGRIGGFKAVKLNDGRDNERGPLRRRTQGGERRGSTGEDGARCAPWPNWAGGDVWAVQEPARRVRRGLDAQEVTCVPVTHTGFVSRPHKVAGLAGGCGWGERRWSGTLHASHEPQSPTFPSLQLWIRAPLGLGLCQGRGSTWPQFARLCAQLCLIFCDPTDCSPPGSTGVGCHFPPRGSSPTRDRTCISCLADGFFTTEPPGKIVVTYPRSTIPRSWPCLPASCCPVGPSSGCDRPLGGSGRLGTEKSLPVPPAWLHLPPSPPTHDLVTDG